MSIKHLEKLVRDLEKPFSGMIDIPAKLPVTCECNSCDVEGCEDGLIPQADGPDDFIKVPCPNPIHN
jgi:hypothetical protein